MNIGGLLANKNGGSGEMREIDISTIGVGERIRVDCGDIESLKQNIQSHGLLNPITVMRRGEDQFFLIAGYRRLQAMKALGAKSIAATVLSPIDAEERLFVEISENEARKSFTCSERLAYAEKIRAIEKEKARQRCATHTRGGYRKNQESEKGRTRDIVAKKVGFASGKTLERAFFVAENRPDLIPLIDTEKLSIFAAFQMAKGSMPLDAGTNCKSNTGTSGRRQKVCTSGECTAAPVQLPPLFLPESIKTSGVGISGADHNELMSNPVYKALYSTYNDLMQATVRMEMLNAQDREEHKAQIRQLKAQLAESTHRIAELESALNGKRVTGCA